jgi:hypothetical protein
MSQKPVRLTGMAKTGLGLAIGSLIPWMLLPVLPFLPLSVAQKAMGAGGLLVLAEVLFWSGALLAGPAIVHRYREKLHPRALGRRLRQVWRRITPR